MNVQATELRFTKGGTFEIRQEESPNILDTPKMLRYIDRESAKIIDEAIEPRNLVITMPEAIKEVSALVGYGRQPEFAIVSFTYVKHSGSWKLLHITNYYVPLLDDEIMDYCSPSTNYLFMSGVSDVVGFRVESNIGRVFRRLTNNIDPYLILDEIVTVESPRSIKSKVVTLSFLADMSYSTRFGLSLDQVVQDLLVDMGGRYALLTLMNKADKLKGVKPSEVFDIDTVVRTSMPSDPTFDMAVRFDKRVSDGTLLPNLKVAPIDFDTCGFDIKLTNGILINSEKKEAKLSPLEDLGSGSIHYPKY